MQRVRAEFRELASKWGKLRTIKSAFQVEGFEPGPEVVGDGQRRSLFDTYANVIDWSDAEQVHRVLRVFEEILSWGADVDDQNRVPMLAKLKHVLQQDGYTIDENDSIRPVSGMPLTRLPLAELRDSTTIEEHLRRLDSTGDADPALAISSAKSLVEATCKHVLEELDTSYDDRSDLPVLVRSVQKALKIHPDVIAPTAKGRKAIIRTLSNLSQIVDGLAELRNEYGPDHGRTRSTTGIGPRHAHLAVGASQTFCRFLLETLRDRRRSES